jgi:AraC-like DNA-binding protein
MTTNQPTPKPARALFGTFSDPKTMALALSGIESSSATVPRQIGTVREAFHGTLARATINGIGVGIGHFAQAIPQTADMPKLHTFMFATEPALVRRVSGRDLFGSQIFHFRPGERTVTGSPRGQPWTFGIIAVPFDQLARTGPVAGVDHGVPLNDDRMFQVPKPAFARLVGLMEDISRIAREAPWIIGMPQPAKALAGTIVDVLLGCLTEGRAIADRAALGRHRAVVARFERALRERPEEMLSLRDICTEVGVAQRTLGLACQEFLGEGPVQYARNHRLERVREMLSVSDPETAMVTSVAMHYGFWELGRFARAYRLRFGERPSETLRRTAS